MKNNKQPLIEVRKLKKFFPLKKTSIFQKEALNVRAVEDISFSIYKGETFGLVGESGCGKSTLGRTILQLYPPTSGSALYYGIPLREANPKYVLEEIEKLPKYQEKARKAYQKSLAVDEMIKTVKEQISNIDPELAKTENEIQLKAYNEKLNNLEGLVKEATDNLVNVLNLTITNFKLLIEKKPYMYVEPNWEEDIVYIINLVKEDNKDSAILDRLELVQVPSRTALKAYGKLNSANKALMKHEAKRSLMGLDVKLQRKLSSLQEKSKNLKKEASRQLREGSRTGGDFILEADLPKIAELMKEEELLSREIYAHKQAIHNLNKQENNLHSLCNDLKTKFKEAKKVVKELDGKQANELDNKQLKELKIAQSQITNLPTRIDALEEEITGLSKSRPEEVEKIENVIAELSEKQKELQATLNSYHRKNVLPITERCLDPKYQDKMENNREYAINLQKLKKEEMRVLRQKLQMIFQDPYSSLDPRMTVGQAISEAVVEHGLYQHGSAELEEYVIGIMAKCGLDHYMIHRYPHQFSGGQRQRIVIARALALQPEFVVCDESVSALDVSIQSQILNLLQDLKEESQLTYLFISHDLSVIKHVSDRIGVMYLGDMVELCASDTLYENSLHPYSKSLISAIPTTTQTRQNRIILKGDIPSNIFPPSGCKFRTRCPLARGKCAKVAPELREVEPGHQVACHFYEETKNII